MINVSTIMLNALLSFIWLYVNYMLKANDMFTGALFISWFLIFEHLIPYVTEN